MQNEPASPPTDAVDAFELLARDHADAARLFAEFDALQGAGAEDRQRIAQIVQQVSAALTLHAQLEEEIFYPAVEQAIGDRGLVEQARQEHAQVKQAVRQLTTMQPDDARLAPAVTQLAQAVSQHVQEEEGRMFAEARGRIDAAAVGAQLAERRRQIEAPPERSEGYEVEET